jgi:hypothetical protein
MDKSQIDSMKQEWRSELALLQKRCAIIENLLRNLDDYEQPAPTYAGAIVMGNKVEVKPIRLTPTLSGTPQESPTAMQRTKATLENIDEPFTLVRLKEKINEDGFEEIGRGNWGVIVQKLKKKGMIVCCEGEEGKPGALYKRASKVASSSGNLPAFDFGLENLN